MNENGQSRIPERRRFRRRMRIIRIKYIVSSFYNMSIYICDLENYHCVYAKEIYKIFNKNVLSDEFVIHKNGPSNANYIITCLSDELNYPNYGDMDSARGENYIENIVQFVNQHIEASNEQKIVTFYCVLENFTDNMINVCYSKNSNDTQSILICPPAIRKLSFNNRTNKSYFISFKGNIFASYYRFIIYEKFKKYNTSKNIIIHLTDNRYEYADLMLNSTFSIIIEGDLPWSYRLTECINAGSIPIIIKPKNNKNIYAFDELVDYSKFSIIIDESEIDELMTNILPNITQEQIENMLSNLEIVNNKYFISRKTQMSGVLKMLHNRRLAFS